MLERGLGRGARVGQGVVHLQLKLVELYGRDFPV